MGCSWVRIQHNVARAEAYLPTKWHLDPSSRLVTTGVDRIWGVVSLLGKAGSPSNTMWREEGPTCVLHVMFHLDPCNRLARTHISKRQTDMTGQDNGLIAQGNRFTNSRQKTLYTLKRRSSMGHTHFNEGKDDGVAVASAG